MDAIEENGNVGAADVAANVTEDISSGFSVRFCPGRRPSLRYQAGNIVSERRYLPLYKGVRYVSGDPACGWKTVLLFHLLGHGETRDEAIEMARKNPYRRNGA